MAIGKDFKIIPKFPLLAGTHQSGWEVKDLDVESN